MGKDYIYAVVPILEDALIDRDLVHSQTACTTVMHMALGVIGLGNEDAMQHLMNLIWPNLFETSPHVINAVMGAIDGMRCCLGPTKVLQYTLQGLFHPARKVRDVYWKVYNNLYIGAQARLAPASNPNPHPHPHPHPHPNPNPNPDPNQAGLVPAYPRIGDDVLNQYQRTHLELFL